MAQTLKIQILVGLAVAALPAFSQAPPKHLNQFSWSIKVTHDKLGTPTSLVSLIINKRNHFVTKVIGNEMKPMTRDQFAGWKVPKIATTACFGWFAGGGDLYYAIERRHALKIYHRAIDESDDKAQNADLVLSINL